MIQFFEHWECKTFLAPCLSWSVKVDRNQMKTLSVNNQCHPV